MQTSDMQEFRAATVHRWSTDDLPATSTTETSAASFATAIALNRAPQIETISHGGFRVATERLDIGPLSIIRQSGSAHREIHPAIGFGGPESVQYSLMVNVQSGWTIGWPEPVFLHAGEGILLDSAADIVMGFPDNHEISIIRFTEAWLRGWLPVPADMVGRPIRADHNWGRSLTSFVGLLRPAMVGRSAVPINALLDQVGSLLALTAFELQQLPMREPMREPIDLTQRILVLIVQRCAETDLCADDIAQALSVSTRTLHRVLAKSDAAFGALLITARARAAQRMLESPLFNKFTTEQIGHRAGFKDQSHFIRTMRDKFGATPTNMRRSSQDHTT
ncbi:helix-turn-helix domain-containing protein [Duganella sp. FT135W]|uniref:Helix-turn-helix domain-containing protein n=1 Tax=Duganella flavida TaxID=2692175 RepID=A0A6L8K9Z9_9BURK|nr:AraC family transcriptional regulator [Duganella flavida]MYM22654.1 helix-turn-helix domain-containing protein [Duganella flavida]